MYAYDLKDLLVLLQKSAPAQVDAVALHRREVEDGLLSVGLKIHCLADGYRFSSLVDGLGGARRILNVNRYKQADASLCLVLPPLGNARSAILLLEAIGQFVGLLDATFSPIARYSSKCVPREDSMRDGQHC